MNKTVNRKLFLITKMLLFLLGFALGFFSIWQTLNSYPDIAKKLAVKITFYAASSLVPAMALMLSAKPVYFLFVAIGEKIRHNELSVKANDIAGVMLGTLMGATAAILTETIFKLFLPIVALRLFIAIIVGVTAAYTTVVLCVKWLRRENTSAEDDAAKSTQKKASPIGGYLLTSSAFESTKLKILCENWLNGAKYILPTVKTSAYQSGLDALIESGTILVLDEFASESEAASALNLKVVVLNKTSASAFGEDVETLILDELA